MLGPCTPPPSREALVEVQCISKKYMMGREPIYVLREASLTVGEGEFVALIGASGSGKSTLLHITGALEQPDEGRVLFRGHSVSNMRRRARHALRNRHFGFVFQFYHLLPELNVLENVLLPAMVAAPAWRVLFGGSPRHDYAMQLLRDFGLDHRLEHRPAELSGGERQRVAIARALVNQPALLLADEPTGNLDSKTGHAILEALMLLHREKKQSILLVTHDPTVAAMADRVVRLQDGRVMGVENGQGTPAAPPDSATTKQ